MYINIYVYKYTYMYVCMYVCMYTHTNDTYIEYTIVKTRETVVKT